MMKDYADTAKAQASMGDPSSVTYALLAVCHRLDTLVDALERARPRPGGRRWDDDGAPVAFACTATMPGHWCTRREHADDRHVWAMSDEEAERILRAGQELGFVAEADPLDEGMGASQGLGMRGAQIAHVADRCGETFDDSSAADDRVWVCTEAIGHVGSHYDAARLVGWGKKLPSMTPDYAAAILSRQTEADPLDESDHRARHFPDGTHLRRYACRRWHMASRHECNDPDHGDSHTLAWWDEPLTFCDCDDTATVEAEADPLDEDDHRPRHDGDGRCWRKDGRGWITDDPRRGSWPLAEIAAVLGPLTFCDCDDTATVEAED